MSSGIQFLVITLVVMFIVLIFLLSYVLNRNTKKPIEIKITPEGCKACKNHTCTHKSEVEE